MMERLSTVNKNILASFVKLANTLGWPIYIDHVTRLKKDLNFPEMKTLIEGDNHSHFYQLEKRNGKWQIQKVDNMAMTVSNITEWMNSRVFYECLKTAAGIFTEDKKRDQDFS